MSWRHALATACLVCCASLACTSWTEVTVPAPPAPMQVFHRPTRVALKDTRSYELTDVVIVSDSLFGTTNDVARIRRSFPLRMVSTVQTQQPSGARTAALAVVLALVAWRSGIFGGSLGP